ncbi:cardiolipin synthase [Marivita hallyeonensis]|uniref:Cardiolipin synthase n=1 Tax=Marivita hallyeonensis TaxID=996342 RepID=A0A1M5N914_9RHOB|nr:cardiolipin synthase [Marivita hallyeonensis]SHG85669.1 cardiolipin synthase [Marivita hallyeonensis]
MTEFLTLGNAAIAIAIGALSLIASYRALLTSRTPQGSVAWILLILLVPIIGVLLYFVFGLADYKSFERDRKKSDEEMFDGAIGAETTHPSPRLSPFARISNLAVTEGNAMSLLLDGHETYSALSDAIAQAQSHIFVQYYTIKDDHVGRSLRDALIERAQAGVKVWVLHDELPLFGLPKAFKKKMSDAGIHLARPQGPKRLLGPFQFNYRNHRKLVIVDNTVAFTGGLNVSKTYLGESAIGAWRDTFARFEGPIVQQLGLHFSSDWVWACGEDLSEYCAEVPSKAGDTNAVALAPSPAEDVAAGNLYFIAAAHAAQSRLWIATPYFAPDRDVLTALRFAALRGVDVKVLVPGRADHYLTYYAAMAYFDDLRSAGGEIWVYDPAFMHQKVILIDDDLSSIGSINLDIRSGLLNFEIAVVMEGKAAAADVEEMLAADLEKARRVDFDLEDRPMLVGMAARISRLFAPIL